METENGLGFLIGAFLIISSLNIGTSFEQKLYADYAVLRAFLSAVKPVLLQIPVTTGEFVLRTLTCNAVT